jgi:hypothetical protein
MVLAFCRSQALRDVYFEQVFQHIDFFAVILLAFPCPRFSSAPSRPAHG